MLGGRLVYSGGSSFIRKPSDTRYSSGLNERVESSDVLGTAILSTIPCGILAYLGSIGSSDLGMTAGVVATLELAWLSRGRPVNPGHDAISVMLGLGTTSTMWPRTRITSTWVISLCWPLPVSTLASSLTMALSYRESCKTVNTIDKK
jgi:hypothetical protein